MLTGGRMEKFEWLNAGEIALVPAKAVCIGRNYREHAAELNNAVPDSPMLFIKPSSSFVAFKGQIPLAQRLGEHHYEAELALLIGQTISASTELDLQQQVIGVGVAMDLTLRNVQAELKSKGHPWEKAKAYDNSCIVSPFIQITEQTDFNNLEFNLSINNEIRQIGHTSEMVFSIVQLLDEIRQYFTLQPGDIVLTGTPKGVGKLNSGDQLVVTLQKNILASGQILLV